MHTANLTLDKNIKSWQAAVRKQKELRQELEKRPPNKIRKAEAERQQGPDDIANKSAWGTQPLIPMNLFNNPAFHEDIGKLEETDDCLSFAINQACQANVISSKKQLTRMTSHFQRHY